MTARERWAERGFIDYDMTMTLSCFCPVTGPVVISVRAGAVQSAHDVATGEPIDSAYASAFPNVEGLFDLIENMAQQEARLEVTYHVVLGYPVRIAINEHLLPVDGGMIYVITDLESI